jgi:hypothetical protein
MIKKICQCKDCGKLFTPAYKQQKFCSIICSNQRNKDRATKVVLPSKKTILLAELFGILLGDGGVERYFMRIYLNRVADRGYEIYIRKMLETLFPGVRVSIWDRPLRGTTEIQISSIGVCEYLRSIGFDAKNRTIPDWVFTKPSFIKAVIRGLFDTEGHMSIKNYQAQKRLSRYGQLTVTNKNKNILVFLEDQLSFLRYFPTKNSQKNIYISNKKDIERYFQEIGSSNPKLLKKLALLQNLS